MAKSKKRVTMHNSRSGYAPHNDRSFDLSKAPHINPDMTPDNKVLELTGYEGDTLKDRERDYYDKHFSAALDAQNARHKARRHTARIRDMDAYYDAYTTRPEETLYYLGNKDNNAGPDILLDAYKDYYDWHSQRFPNCTILNVALHVDEATPHLHERKVWWAEGPDGPYVAQADALKAMGIERPNPDKPSGRYNNAKMTYSRLCRDKFVEIALSYGLELELTPKEPSQVGLTQAQYKAQQELKRIEVAQKDLDDREDNLNDREDELNKKVQERELELDERERKVVAREHQLDITEQELFQKERLASQKGYKAGYDNGYADFMDKVSPDIERMIKDALRKEKIYRKARSITDNWDYGDSTSNQYNY